MKIAILGASGMLGTDLMTVLNQKLDTYGFDRDVVDITKEDTIVKAVQPIKPDWIINCAAYTAVDLCETESERAFQINGYAVKNIAVAAKQVGAKVIHISTDYVFDGARQEGYREDDMKNPLSVYGKSKALGEDILLAEYPEGAYLVRTAWLYGKHGNNFVTTILDLAKKKELLKVVNDQVGSPTCTIDVSQGILSLLWGNDQPGIYHMVNSGACSWFDFAKEIYSLKKLPVTVTPIPTTEFPRPAKRPAYSILVNTKLPTFRHWKEALQAFLKTL